jgi:hypothetical protein
MSSVLAPDDIARDARWLAQALDSSAGIARVIEMDREAYRQASFLDDRMLQRPVNAQLVAWTMVAEAVGGMARRDARWIFHIGHVGSTLIAQLLGELPNVLAIREPRLLRDLSAVPADQRHEYSMAAQALFSRTFAPDEIAVVKATSFVSEIAPELVPSGARALFMYATPENYVASILAGENSRQELKILAPSRALRLAKREIRFPEPREDANRAVIAWACEMTSLERAAEAMAGREVAWLDFDAFLKSPEARLSDAATFFAFDNSGVPEIANGPLMCRYSKALEYEYSAGLRHDLIVDAISRHRSQIEDALAMLGAAAEKSPLLARALARCGES